MKKVMLFSLFFCVISFLYLTPAFSLSWFESEKEIKDEYLEKLFAPDFPYESVKVLEDSKGDRFIVINANESVKDKMGIYANLLLSRGVNIHGDYYYGYFSWQTSVTEFDITITRKVEGEPDTIEVSRSSVKDPETGKPIVAITGRWKEIRIAVDKGFGKNWRKIKILPDREPNALEPKIGRYPGSKLIYAYDWPVDKGGGRLLRFAVRASIKEVAYYYKSHLEKVLGGETSGSSYWEKMVENPSRYRYSLEVFGIKTVGVYVNFSQIYEEYRPRYGKVRLAQSNDPNLSEYVLIEYELSKWSESEEGGNSDEK